MRALIRLFRIRQKSFLMPRLSVRIPFLTWHSVAEEVGVAYERVTLAAVHEGEAGGPVDEGADANIQPVLDQDVHCVLRPEIQLSTLKDNCLFTVICDVVAVLT